MSGVEIAILLPVAYSNGANVDGIESALQGTKPSFRIEWMWNRPVVLNRVPVHLSRHQSREFVILRSLRVVCSNTPYVEGVEIEKFVFEAT